MTAANHRFRAIPEPLPLQKDAPDPKVAEVERLAEGRRHTRRDVLRELIEEQKRDMVTHSVGEVGRAYVNAKKQAGARATTHHSTEVAIHPYAVEWADPVGEEAVERVDMWREVMRLREQAEDDEDVA